MLAACYIDVDQQTDTHRHTKSKVPLTTLPTLATIGTNKNQTALSTAQTVTKLWGENKYANEFRYKTLQTSKWWSSDGADALEQQNKTKSIGQLLESKQIHQDDWRQTDIDTCIHSREIIHDQSWNRSWYRFWNHPVHCRLTRCRSIFVHQCSAKYVALSNNSQYEICATCGNY